MIQQINLYQPNKVKAARGVSVPRMLNVLLAVALLLLLISAYEQWRMHRQTSQLQQLLAMKATEAAQLEELRRKNPPQKKSVLLQQELERLRARHQLNAALIDQINISGSANVTGFSPQLAALASRDQRGLWLQMILFKEGGRQVRLDGRTLSPELVPRYLRQLSEEKVFTGLAFRQFSLSRPEDKEADWLDFTLETMSPEGP